MLNLIGRIVKNNKGTKLLVIHSKKLSERVNDNKNNISIKNYWDGLAISPKGDIHVTIAAKKRLQIAITNLVKSNKIFLNDKKNVKIYLNENVWGVNKNDLISKGIGLPISNDAPNDLITKNAAIRVNNRKYYLDISSKKLHDLAKNSRIKCLFIMKENSIIIVRSEEFNARKLTPHSKKRVQISIPKELLNNDKIKKLGEKGWLPLKLQLNLKTFGLEISDFYHVKEEKDLVRYLISKGIKIKIKEPADPYDILLKEKDFGIEVHNSLSRDGDLVTRHKIKPGMIRLRILEADLLVRTKELSTFCLIINKEWENGKYIQEIIDKVDKNVKVFFTDFKNKWYEEIGDKLITLK